jgi:hypothetical protein
MKWTLFISFLSATCMHSCYIHICIWKATDSWWWLLINCKRNVAEFGFNFYSFILLLVIAFICIPPDRHSSYLQHNAQFHIWILPITSSVSKLIFCLKTNWFYFSVHSNFEWFWATAITLALCMQSFCSLSVQSFSEVLPLIYKHFISQLIKWWIKFSCIAVHNNSTTLDIGLEI